MKRLPIKGYEGLYEVDESGCVYSVDRNILGNDGNTYPFKGKKLALCGNKNVKYLVASLWKDNKGTNLYVHRLVAIAFIENPKNKAEVNHKDGDRLNNHVDNLEWVTRSENAHHAIKTGLKVYTNRLTREEFIECLYAVIDGESYASLTNRVPYQVPFLSTKVRKIAKELNVEYLLDESLKLQKQKRGRINGAKNSQCN